MEGDRHLTPLDSTNYQRWKYEVMVLLESKEILEIVLGTETIPRDDNTAATQGLIKTSKREDALGRSVLVSHLSCWHLKIGMPTDGNPDTIHLLS
jgi:hypothetical protein